jgi:hypothetical protein
LLFLLNGVVLTLSLQVDAMVYPNIFFLVAGVLVVVVVILLGVTVEDPSEILKVDEEEEVDKS